MVRFCEWDVVMRRGGKTRAHGRRARRLRAAQRVTARSQLGEIGTIAPNHGSGTQPVGALKRGKSASCDRRQGLHMHGDVKPVHARAQHCPEFGGVRIGARARPAVRIDRHSAGAHGWMRRILEQRAMHADRRSAGTHGRAESWSSDRPAVACTSDVRAPIGAHVVCVCPSRRKPSRCPLFETFTAPCPPAATAQLRQLQPRCARSARAS